MCARRQTIIHLSAAILLGCALLLSAGRACGAAPGDMFGFARYLELKNEFYRAVTEYERFIYFNPDHSLIEDAKLRIARCYIKGGEYDQAEVRLRLLLNASSRKSILFKTRLSMSEIEYRRGNYGNSLIILSRAEDTFEPDPGRRFTVQYAGVWNRIRARRPDSALKVLRETSDTGGAAFDLAALETDIAKIKDLRRKSPVLAGALSVVLPGSGQLYAGRPRDALSAFLWNALFIGAAIWAVESDHDEAALVLGAFELTWYSANIYNAVNNAKKFNNTEWMNHLRYLERTYPDPYNASIFDD